MFTHGRRNTGYVVPDETYINQKANIEMPEEKIIEDNQNFKKEKNIKQAKQENNNKDK